MTMTTVLPFASRNSTSFLYSSADQKFSTILNGVNKCVHS